MKKILLVSNKIAGDRNFIDALKTRYFVDAMGFMNTALYKIRSGMKYDLAVIEVGVPSYGIYSLKETKDGHKTGLVFYEKEIKNFGIPTVLWSWGSEFEEEINSKNDPKLIFVQKELEEDHLLKAIKNFLK